VHESITTTTDDHNEAEVDPEDASEDIEAKEKQKRSNSTEGHASSFQFYFLVFLSCHSKHSSADDAVESLRFGPRALPGPGFVPASGQALCTRYSNSSSLDLSSESHTAKAQQI
jgi:hypothetical protein